VVWRFSDMSGGSIFIGHHAHNFYRCLGLCHTFIVGTYRITNDIPFRDSRTTLPAVVELVIEHST